MLMQHASGGGRGEGVREGWRRRGEGGVGRGEKGEGEGCEVRDES